MEQANLKQLILKILKADDRLWNEDKTELNQTLLLDLVEKIDEKLIDLLLQEKELRDKFFVKMRNVYVFKTNDFRFFMEENKIDNSYTKYKNRIGLTDGKRFLKDTNDVVLNWPYKDCVLEGGQSTEEGTDTYFEYDNETKQYEKKKAKRKEIFFNHVLAHDEIDRLFDPKALVNWKRYTKNGEEKVKEIKRDKDGTIKENMIIKGNNLLALHSLKKQFAGKIKLIYIDPPYNTGNDGFKYNDNFNHSTWLTFMKNRLEVAKELLTSDGTLFISIDNEEHGYLRILCDEVFGRNNFITNLTWQRATSTQTLGQSSSAFSNVTEYVLCYAKEKNTWMRENGAKYYLHKPIIPIVEILKSGYSYILDVPIEDEEKWNIIEETEEYTISKYKENFKYSLINSLVEEKIKTGKIKDLNNLHDIVKNNYQNIFTLNRPQSGYTTLVNFSQKCKVGEFLKVTYTPQKGRNKDKKTNIYIYGGKYNKTEKGGRVLVFLKDKVTIKDGQVYFKKPLTNLLTQEEVNVVRIRNEGNIMLPYGKKPEGLLKILIENFSSKGDIVLDFFMGTGTTCAVAHKMGRRYIGVEQLDYGGNSAVVRLKNVIKGDKTGISEEVGWKGGGDFIYFELAKWNETAKEKILACKSLDELSKFFNEMYERYFLNYNLKIKEFKEKVIYEQEFKNLSLDEQKKMFIAMLDNNQMYVNKTEMADKKFEISEEDQNLTLQFYNSKI